VVLTDGDGASIPGPDDLSIRELTSVEEFDRAVDLFCTVWAAGSPVDLVNASTLRAWSMSDNYVAGAYLDEVLVGASVAFRGKDDLRSHLLGVLPAVQSRGYGTRMKQHQLEWAHERNFSTVCWTFDPLVRRNAHFSLRKLGARVVDYQENLYGKLNDGINDGEETDRLVVEWTGFPDDRAAVTDRSAAALLGRSLPDEAEIDDGGPLLWSPDRSVGLIVVPSGIETLRVADHKRALQWRGDVRGAFDEVRRQSYQWAGFSADGCYVFRKAAAAR
jgi:predicted GNAT superfamily acetyltransferase